jgi:hypothetical protein
MTGVSLYSTAENLHIDFRTQGGRAEATTPEYRNYWEIDKEKQQRMKGFLAEFEFSRRFVDLGQLFRSQTIFDDALNPDIILTDFIQKGGVHVPGTGKCY